MMSINQIIHHNIVVLRQDTFRKNFCADIPRIPAGRCPASSALYGGEGCPALCASSRGIPEASFWTSTAPADTRAPFPSAAPFVPEPDQIPQPGLVLLPWLPH